MKEIINKKTLEKLISLAKIEIKEENKEKIIIDLGKILEHFNELQNLNIEDIKPLNGGTDLSNICKNDEIKSVDRKILNNDLIGQFPEKENGFLKIPPVFE